MERLVTYLARDLPARGFEVHIVVIEGLGRFAEGIPHEVFHQVPPMNKWSLVRPTALATVLESLNPQIVHSHTGIWYKTGRAGGMAKVPVRVHTEHGRRVPDTITDRLIDNLASRHSDAVIAVSDALAQVLRQRVVHNPDRVRVIVNGVPISERSLVDRSELREALGLPRNAIVVGSVGRLEPVKNYRLALETFARVRTGPDAPVFLVLAGDGSERLMLELTARQLGIADRVRFLGWRDDVERLYQALDVFVLTSRSEGMSVSLLEAMAIGLCPVVTDVGGNREVMGEALDAMVVPSFEPADLATAWEKCIHEPTWRMEIGERARLRVEQHFSLTHMVDQHVALYRALLQDRHG
jgi:glycosyltransferase involved in cell wall biosynthesis